MIRINNSSKYAYGEEITKICPICEIQSKVTITSIFELNNHESNHPKIGLDGQELKDLNGNLVFDEYKDFLYIVQCPCGGKFIILTEDYDSEYTLEDKIIYPSIKKLRIDAHEDTPESIKPIFEEAVSILDLSPRSSAALTRLALEKLCDYLGATPSKNLNNKIQELIDKGLDSNISYIFDGIRIFGNDGVHDTGLIDLNEKDSKSNSETLLSMFNYIVEDVITRKKKRTEFVNSIPKSKIQQIEERGKKN
ncbi:TPA: DUF4145 domain-containing protein [Enterococcus faecalis]|uniref:DUF4145 domain-containing protein n=1 Tax=Enterococcus faecalis TaxID=1351 RepID=UPI0022429CDE|nr:DUF4145 domain-containing protein [Enterococcus faecalis]MDT2211137.1 DUF4145 domain-containing protein [Enterococcus faecalis]HAP3466371.1 DUF4145 domain-containing protein [Enterococcus faecalis]HAP3471835.1 DUF4145 domain-containing protein [Enterococcus faecalis]HAP3475301.1 DUF4145 domain-containing protein [Enterococcus faecalis]HAP3478201.1 DUF4145 domain-containing protein [Enterococcus faecalis]